MTNVNAFTLSQELLTKILNKMLGLNKRRKEFIIHILLLYWGIRGRYTFLNLSRYGKYHEWSYRRQFEKDFDWLGFNAELIRACTSEHRILAFDPSYLPKSGKHTPGMGKFWSGCAQAVKAGLEMASLAVVDVEQHTAFSLEALQTPAPAQLKAEDKTLTHHYAQMIVERQGSLKALADYLVCDGWFAKKKFVDAIVEQTELHLVSKLRSDADLYYLYQGERTGQRGRPKIYDGKVNTKQIDSEYFLLEQDNTEKRLYSAIVYAKGLKRKVKLAYVEFLDEAGTVKNSKFFFSTDLGLSAKLIYHYYRVRFQQEFLFRDAKQYTGLTHCQARSKNKLNFHLNAALTSVSLAKVMYSRCTERKGIAFSMADVKTLSVNKLLLERIFGILEIPPEVQINNPKIRQLETIGLIAA